MSNSFDLIQYIKSSSVIQGSPSSTNGKTLIDGGIEHYGDYSLRARKQINYHLINGTDVPAIRNTMIAGIVGDKINIQSRSENKNINESFEALIKEHGKKDNFDITKRFHRNEAFRQIIGNEVVQGGMIVRHHYSTRWNIPYKVELVSVNMIDTRKTYEHENVYNGLKKDRDGAVIGIYLFTDSKKITSILHSTANMTIYSPVWMDISQYTAVSRLVSLLQTLDSSIIYKNAEITAAIERAKAGVYWHTDLYTQLQSAIADAIKSLPASDQVTEIRDIITKMANRGVGANGATPTPKEDTITQIDNKTDSVYQALTDDGQKAMASAMGGSQVSVYRDIEKGNYSSIKAAISFDEENYKIEFDRLVENVIEEYLVRLFRVGVQTNRITLARSKYFTNPEKYHKWDILRTSKRVIDGTKDATETAKNLESKTTTLQRVYAEKGLDYITEMEKQINVDIEVEQMRKKAYENAGLTYEENKKVEK